MFTEGDVAKRGVKIMRDGQPLEFSSLREGDKLTATIVTSKPPKVMTERQVQASMQSVPAAAPAGRPVAAGAPANAPAPAGAATTGSAPAPARRLPKTGSALPLLGLLGAALVTLGAALTARRRLSPGARW
jgi:LPXTG-motif cell wall-anchored protein